MEFWLILAPVTLAIAIGLSVTALSSLHWIGGQLSVENFQYYAGLWTECAKIVVFIWDSQWVCGAKQWSTELYPYGLAVKILVVSSVVFGLITAVAAAFAYRARSWMWCFWAALLACLQVILLMAGLLTYVAGIRKYDDTFIFSWSYGIGWVSVIFYMLTVIIYVIQAKRLKSNGTGTGSSSP